MADLTRKALAQLVRLVLDLAILLLLSFLLAVICEKERVRKWRAGGGREGGRGGREDMYTRAYTRAYMYTRVHVRRGWVHSANLCHS